MGRKVFVVGHKNPDTDSVVSAVGMAELLRHQGMVGVVPGRQGEIWRETRYVLERFGVPVPELVADVRPRARDVMATEPIVGRPDESAYCIGRRLRERGIRAMPLVDQDQRLMGLISVEDFAHILLNELNRDLVDKIHLDVRNVADTLEGRLLVEAQGRRLRDKVMVAAMDAETMRARVEPDILLVMGDRENAQRIAIEEGVGALVITGGLPVSPDILELARARNVTLIASPHHTFTTVRLLNLSIPVSTIMQCNVVTAALDDPLDDLREALTRQRTVPVLDGAGHVAGIVSRSDLINPLRHGVYLVDHNERSQTVDGLDEAELLGIVDHHRIADIQSAAPALFRNEIVGSTSTIIAALFTEAGIAIPPPIAGILLGGQITDTVLFRSPTTTSRDLQIAERLAALAQVDLAGYGQDIFSVASEIAGRTARDIITTDFKEFRIDDTPFGVGYTETVNKRPIEQMRDALLAEMRAIRSDKGYASVLFMIVDLVRNQTEILVAGMEDQVGEALGHHLAPDQSILVEGVMSRKKQVVPILPNVARQWREGRRT